jgi:tetratricopeptide (TPR) repeat protein
MGTQLQAQSNAELKAHFEKYYELMKLHGDIPGVINAMSHLEVLEPSQARRDTLAYLYVSENQFLQALNVVGVDKNPNDSDLNVEVKATALKNLNQPKLAIEQYEVYFGRKPGAPLAYEIADLMIQVDDIAGAKAKIEYGLANVTDDMKRAFYERQQQPYQASLKAAFHYLKGIVLFKEDQKANIDQSLKLVNEALTIDPNFNLAKITRDALEQQKAQMTKQN